MENKKTTLCALVLAASAAMIGCDKPQLAYEDSYEATARAREEARYKIKEEINKFAVYETYDKGRMRYDKFVSLTGIPKDLPESADDLPVWVEVVTGDTPSATIEKGYGVHIKIPESMTQEVRFKLHKFWNEFHGLKPLTDDDIKNCPPGGY